ncbi:hypothetical protein J0H58_31465 [bacterium]|nr:hypothetical protein [bacterium]
MTCVHMTVALVVLVAVGTILGQHRTRRIAAGRVGETFDTFSAGFSPGDAPPEILRAVYAQLQDWCSGAVYAFPVRAGDDLGRVYGLVEDDLDEQVLEVMARCGRRLPSAERLQSVRGRVPRGGRTPRCSRRPPRQRFVTQCQ